MLNIPDEKLPSEFKDEDRLNSLFSPFRSRTVNPRDWETKIASWRQLILLYCINNSVYSFTLSQLNKLFIRNGRPPSGLNVIVEELIKSGELQHIEEFLKEASHGWGAWATDLLVKKPVSWSYSTLKRSLFATKINPEQVYVHCEAIETDSQALFAAIPEKYRNKVINFNTLLQITKKDINTADNLQLLLHHLEKAQKIAITKLYNESAQKASKFDSFLIKFGEIGANKITEIEISRYVLEQNEALFTRHVEELEDDVTAAISQAKAHLAKSHRHLAKSCLRKKHEIEKRLARKLNALHNIQVLLEKVKDVDGDSDALASYRCALDAFNTTFKEKGLNEDAVEDTMTEMADVLDIHDDIQAALARPVRDEDEADLEAELAELMAGGGGNGPGDDDSSNLEDVDEEFGKLGLDKMPDVPNEGVSLPEASQV